MAVRARAAAELAVLAAALPGRRYTFSRPTLEAYARRPGRSRAALRLALRARPRPDRHPRAQGRFAVSAFLALAMLAANGAARLLKRVPRPGMRAAAWVALGALCLLEYGGGQPLFAVQIVPDLASPPAVYKWLAAQPPAAIVELPLTSEMALPPTGLDGNAGEAWPDYNVMRYQYFGLDHWQASVDGYSGFTPPHHRELGLTLADFPSAHAVAVLRALGVQYVVVHGGLLDAFQPGRAAQLRRGRRGNTDRCSRPGTGEGLRD